MSPSLSGKRDPAERSGRRREPLPVVLFTDLDETLLDRETYSFAAAREALREVRRRSIPLVLCTSKTAAETLHLQDRLRLREPFVAEAGAAVHIPRGYFSGPIPEAEVDGDRLRLALACPRSEVLRGYDDLRAFTEGSIRGFSEMTLEEVVRETGLSPKEAARAMSREFDEPFRFLRREEEFAPRLSAVAEKRGLFVTRGGRYYHLHGRTDKGRAVGLLAELYRRELGPIRTIAVGDSRIDLPMLAAVDVPLLVARHDGTHDATVTSALPRLRAIPRPGPAGWNEGVLRALSEVV